MKFLQQRAVEPLPGAVCPGMLYFCQSVLDTKFPEQPIKAVIPGWVMYRELLAIVGQYRGYWNTHSTSSGVLNRAFFAIGIPPKHYKEFTQLASGAHGVGSPSP